MSVRYSEDPEQCDHAFVLQGPFYSKDKKRIWNQLKCAFCNMVRRKGKNVGVNVDGRLEVVGL